MCGIAGFVGQGDQTVLARMIGEIHYRGPDEEGILLKNKIGLAQARLSIIDLSPAGHQPMSNPAETIWIVFNGEVYNFVELRQSLMATGRYRFRSQTDTEVIIYLYQEWGEKAFEKLNGMFAIGLYDSREDKLILARDRMGKKPLYWGVFNSTLVFASEPKSILQHPAYKKELNLQALNQYLFYEYVPTPQSLWKDIYKLEPATYLVWEKGRVRKEFFWRMDFSKQQLSASDSIDELDKLLNQAVRQRLVADVPLGIFLSGGLDSSTIAYYAQRNSQQKIKTFSVGFADRSYDESRYAEIVARFLNTDHHSLVVTERDSLAAIEKIFFHLDEPLADASIIPTYLLSHFTRQHVTVALGGDGGDELLAGYQTFQAQSLARVYELIPYKVRRFLIEKIISVLPINNAYFSLEFKLKRFTQGFYGPKQYRHLRWLSSFDKTERAQLFQPEVWSCLQRGNEYFEADVYLDEVKNYSLSDKIIYLYLRMYLMDDVLVKVDRASMFNSLEVRAPFLDYHVVDFVNKLEYSLKSKRLQTKIILKELMKDKLPQTIVYRKKRGFGVPLARWLRGDLKVLCNEVLSLNSVQKSGLFNYHYISQLKEQHFSGKKNNAKQLWTLMVFFLWQKKWFS